MLGSVYLCFWALMVFVLILPGSSVPSEKSGTTPCPSLEAKGVAAFVWLGNEVLGSLGFSGVWVSFYFTLLLPLSLLNFLCPWSSAFHEVEDISNIVFVLCCGWLVGWWLEIEPH